MSKIYQRTFRNGLGPRCSNCGTAGHYKRTCQASDSESTSMSLVQTAPSEANVISSKLGSEPANDNVPVRQSDVLADGYKGADSLLVAAE